MDAMHTHQVQRLDFVSLDGIQKARQLKFWQHDYSIATVGTRLGDDDQSINVAQRKETEADFGTIAWPVGSCG